MSHLCNTSVIESCVIFMKMSQLSQLISFRNSRDPEEANGDELDSPTKTRRSPRKRRTGASKNRKLDVNGDNSDEGVSSANTNSRTLSTAATDMTSSSGHSSMPPGQCDISKFQ